MLRIIEASHVFLLKEHHSQIQYFIDICNENDEENDITVGRTSTAKFDILFRVKGPDDKICSFLKQNRFILNSHPLINLRQYLPNP